MSTHQTYNFKSIAKNLFELPKPPDMHHIDHLLHNKNSLRPLTGKSRKSSASNDSASQLAQRTYTYFYSPKNAQFQAKVKSHSTLGENERFGYTVWPVIIMTQVVAECLSSNHLKHSLLALQAYWNSEKHGFCAWKMFPGNEDIYFDDNAHATQALIDVSLATNDPKYLNQAKAILLGLLIPASRVCDGALPWHISDYSTRHACSIGPAAVAALRIALIEEDHALVVFAEKALLWLINNLQDPADGLIWDSMKIQPDGARHINQWKWSYNTGFAIHAFTLLYEATAAAQHLETAAKIAEAAMNPDGSLFDDTLKTHSPDKFAGNRMYSDGSFFLHHLMDGYLALSKHTLTDRLQIEISRLASWGREWMFDPSDSMYFRGCRPYTISEDLTKKFNAKFGTEKELEKNGEERDDEGELCKTLLGNAGWARIFWLEESLKVKPMQGYLG